MLQACDWDVGAVSDLWKGTGPPQYLHAKFLPIFALVENGWMLDMTD